MSFNEALWRTHPQLMHIKAAFIRPVIVFERRIDQSTFVYPLAELTYDDPDGGIGVHGDVKEGMLLGVYSGTDVFKGWLRIRKDPTSTILYVSEVSQGDIDFSNNQKLVVYDDYRLYARIPRMTEDKVFYKDYDLAYSTQGDKIPPIANTGPHYAQKVDPVTGKVDVAFDGSNSYHLAAGIAGTLTYNWNFKDGNVISGSSSSAAATVRFDAGQRWVKLTVTDANGKTGWARCAVITMDENTEVPVQLLRLSGSVDTGWECAVRVLADDVSDLLPGTLMILYSDQYYGNMNGVINGYPDRQHILFTGWINDEDLAVQPFVDDLVLNARSALGILQTLPAFTASLEQNATPTEWHHMVEPTWFRAMAYLMMWHSTLPHVCDIERPDFWEDYIFPAADFTAGTIYDQLKTEAEHGWTRLTEDHNGRIYIRRNPHLMRVAERAALAVTVHLVATDWREGTQIQRPARPRMGWLRGGGFCDTSGDLKLALAPGDAPGQGAQQTELNGNWIIDQDDLNKRLGHYYAWQNLNTPYLQITLNHQGMPFDPAWQELVKFTLDDATNRRGLGINAGEFVIKTYDISHDSERAMTTEILTLEALADGNSGITQDVPDEEWGDYTPPDTPLDDWTTPDPPIVPGGSGLKNVLMAVNRIFISGGTQRHGLILATDLSAPSWADVTDGLPLVYGTVPYACPEIRRMYLDMFSPGAAYVFIHHTGIQLAHGLVYYNPDWRNGGTWTPLLTWQDVVDSGKTNIVNPADCHISDALISFSQAGLCYVVVSHGDNNMPVAIRIANYGEDVEYSPEMYHEDWNYGTYINERVSIALGHDNPDKIWILGRYSGRVYTWMATWGNFPVNGDGRWIESIVRLTNNAAATAFHINPYFKLDGTRNLDTQFFYTPPYAADRFIEKSEAGGVNGSFAAWTAAGNTPYSGERDRFDVPGKAGMRAWWRFEEKLNVLKTTDPDDITQYTIPGFTEDGFTLHWPFNPGQYYAAQNVEYNDEDPAPILKMTTDADGAVWTDLTSNMWELLSRAGTYYTVHESEVVGFCPHWTET